MFPLQQEVLWLWNQKLSSVDHLVFIITDTRTSLRWWHCLKNSSSLVPLVWVNILTDVCLTGWGAHMQEKMVLVSDREISVFVPQRDDSCAQGIDTFSLRHPGKNNQDKVRQCHNGLLYKPQGRYTINSPSHRRSVRPMCCSSQLFILEGPAIP